MDPWLRGRCRLAERRGLLTGKRCSRVQTAAVEILLYDESIAEQRSKTDEALALLGQMLSAGGVGGVASAPDADGSVVEELTEENLNDDEGTIAWQMPQMDPKDALGVLADLGGGGSMGLSDLS